MRDRYSTAIIEDVYPELDCGRHPVKREVGDVFEVWADVVKEGHEKKAAAVLYRKAGEAEWTDAPMRHVENDRWTTSFPLTENARYEYTVEAWVDEWATWLDEVEKKSGAGQHVELELAEGRELVKAAHKRSKDKRLKDLLGELDGAPYEQRLELMLSPAVRELVALYPDRKKATRYGKMLEVYVDRVRARFAAWYEIFPRSQGTVPNRSATFDDCIERLPYIKDLGFDVVYCTPIHPIGKSFRKGRNNALVAGPEDPGSPYAIGSEEGGHRAVHPELGTLEDFRRFVEAAKAEGMDVALDLALNASPDHPYIREHPEWFKFRPDGTIKYSENPPKKYQDIVNPDWYCKDWKNLWREWREVILHWVEQGVKTFRVDNPHTKPVPFWEWVIREVQDEHPDVIFLSEAFTRPKMMRALAKVGFTQSYTYFTWRNEKWELIEYLTELTQDWPREYMRPNFFANTHDILPHILQFGGRPAFISRLVLAATMSSVYGIYNGYELCENTPRGERGTTVYYQDSEVYEYKVWDWDRPGNIKDYVRRVNEIRRDNPALHELTNLQFHHVDNDQILFYSKVLGDNAILCAVNLDPHNAHEGWLQLPLELLGVGEHEPYDMEELISSRRFEGRVGRGFWVRLEPNSNPAEIFRFEKVRPQIGPPND